MGDNDGLPAVEIGHQGLQLRVSQILAVAVGGKFHTIGPKHFQGISGLFYGFFNIRQREGGAEEEPSGMEGFQRGGFFVEPAADGGRFHPVAKVRLRCGHGKDGGADAGLVHELKMGIGTPGGNGEALVHLHPVGFHGFQVGIWNHVAVHIYLRTA